MTSPSRKGWCPSLLNPMAAGDGWLVRIKPTAATLPARAASRLAELVGCFGNGLIDLTNRANLQIRGLEPAGLEPFARAVIDLDLAAADPDVEQRRNVLASPLGPDDPAARFDAHAVAASIEAMLACEPDLKALPAKFGFAVDGGGAIPLGGIETDIIFRPLGDRLVARLSGAPEAAPVTADTAADAARRLALAFLRLGQGRAPAPRRMRDLVAAVGAPAVFAAAGLAASLAAATPPTPLRPVGFTALSDRGSGAAGLGLPFGQLDAPTLARLGELSLRFGDGTLRTTPWRAVILPGVHHGAVPELMAAAAKAGLIVDSSDPRLDIVTCVGKPACPSAAVDARADAARLTAVGPVSAGIVHVSGCSKGCAHPGPAAVTLVGDSGRYGIVIGGRAGDVPEVRGLGIEDAAEMLVERIRGGQE